MDQTSHGQQSYPQQPQGSVEPGKIFVGGLSWETTQEKLQEYFEKYGEISDCVIMQDPITKRPRGFGFVTFKDPASVTQVVTGGPHVLDNKTVDPKPATVKNAAGQGAGGGGGQSGGATKKIFVGGIANGTSEDDVRTYFGQYGTVTDLDLKYDKATQRMRGFGFVGFESEDVVEKLVQTHFHQINGKTVEVKRAEPRYATAGQGYSGSRGNYQPYGGNVGRGGYSSGGYGGSMGATNYGGYGYGTQQQQQQQYGGNYSAYNYPTQGSQYGAAGYDYSSYYARYPPQQPASSTEQPRSDSSYAYQQPQQQQQQYDYPGGRTNYASDSYGQQPAATYSYDSTAGYTAAGYTDAQSSAGYGRGQQQQQQPRGGTYGTYNR